MGSCLSKKCSFPPPSAVTTVAAPPSDLTRKAKKEDQGEQKQAVQAQEIVKKEIFLIKQRKSHERRPEEKGTAAGNTVKDECNSNGSHVHDNNGEGPATVRISSCTKEEVDAILIQCGRLSRSSSGKVPHTSDNSNNSRGLSSSESRKYSGSKRSYDFDHDSDKKKGSNVDADDEAEEDDEEKQHLYQRQSRPSRSHRRTPSREKDVDNKRSSSRDRVSSGGEERSRSGGRGKRVSRSPGRRSENPITATGPAYNPGPDKSKPGRMVSVPVSISTKEKTNFIPDSASGIKRVSVKKSGEIGGGPRTAASPRSQSPANTRAPNENAQQVISLSRNSSKKAEHSPYRRNPMSDIDENILRNEQVSLRSAHDLISSKATVNKLQMNREGNEERLTKKPSQFQCLRPDERNSGVSTEHPHGTTGNTIRGLRENNAISCKAKEQERIVEERNVAVTAGATRADSLKPQTITRSRSSRRSRDLDLNHDTLLNPTSYASMLLEDIQNFHQQNINGFSLPPCVTKACSILEAVADLNSCTSSNLSSVFSGDRISETDRSQKNITTNSHFGKKMDTKDPILESEVGMINDLLEPNLHKYVTVRRGLMGGEMEQQESSGSNSFLNASFSWEPNSADSTECWSSLSNNRDEEIAILGESGQGLEIGKTEALRKKNRDEEKEQQSNSSPVGYQKQEFLEPTGEIEMGGRRSMQRGNDGNLLSTAAQNGRKRLSDYSQVGIGHGKMGAKGQITPIVAAASS